MPKRSNDNRDAAESSRVYLARLGKRVRTLRERQGVTLKRLAQLSGLSDRYIIEVEKGNANPSLESVINLAYALQTSLTGLLPDDSKHEMIESGGPARELMSLLEKHPREQIFRVLASVSSFLEQARGTHVALVGMRGAGKTTVGHLLAQRMKVPFYELDELIEKDTGLSLGEIFDLEGEEYYRAVEEKTLQRILKRPPGIVAVGGGLVMNPTAFLLLKLHAFIVWLQASPETLISRVRRGKDELRLSSHPQVGKQLKMILDRRIPHYSQADFLVNTNGKSPDAVSKAIIHKFRNFGKPRSVR